MKYDVKFIMCFQGDFPQIETMKKLAFVPRIGDKIVSEIFRLKSGKESFGKTFEVLNVKFYYNDDLSEIDFIEVEVENVIQ